MDLAVKVYPEGKMGQHLNHLKVGDALDFKGPLMKISIDELCNRRRLGLIAGGSGLTPMLQARWVLAV
jgi:cytochrome-b5 reductase